MSYSKKDKSILDQNQIEAGLNYLSQLVRMRITIISQNDPFFDWHTIAMPDCSWIQDPLSDFFKTPKLSQEELIILLIALTPHLRPQFFDKLFQEFLQDAGDFPHLGGTRGKQYRGFMPTGETVVFLLAGTQFQDRFVTQQLFDVHQKLYRHRILWLEEVPQGDPQMSGKIILAQEYIDVIIKNTIPVPRFGINFPAQLLETEMDWSDLVLNDVISEQIEEIQDWLEHHTILMKDWGMSKKLKPGYRALFYGPPGTGKTLTATLLGKLYKKPVYKIDLSLIVSKFIGETEKNLAQLFDKAENKDWILFFDEADALFGKRTSVKDAHDRYANQEVSYLLQRVEQYNGLVILASNFKSNMDDAFVRRFNIIINFPIPSAQERYLIWQKAFPDNVTFDADINFLEIANQYKLSGANIMNIVHYCCIKALAMQITKVSNVLLKIGIQREFSKEGKLV